MDAAASVGNAAAGLFGQVARLGQGVDVLGQNLLRQENLLRDDEAYRIGLSDARQVLQGVEADVDAGRDWRVSLEKRKGKILEKSPEFMTPEAASRYRLELDDLFERGGSALEERQQRLVASRAKAAFSADWASAVGSGDLERMENVLGGGVGVYVDSGKAVRMMDSAKKRIGEQRAARDFEENPDQLTADLIDGKYNGVLSKTAIAQYGRLLQDQSGVPTTVSLYDVTGMPLGDGGKRLYDQVLLDEPFGDDEVLMEGAEGMESGKLGPGLGGATHGESSKKEVFKSGVADPVVDLMRVRMAEGRVPTTEEIGLTSMMEVMAADVSGFVKDGGVGSPSHMFYVGELKRRWKDHGVSNDFQDAMESSLENRIKGMQSRKLDKIGFDVDDVMKTMESTDEFISADARKNLSWHRDSLREFEIEMAAGSTRKSAELVAQERRKGTLKLEVERWSREAEIQNKRNGMEMRRWAVEWQATHPGEKNSMTFMTAMKEKIYKLTGRNSSTLEFLMRQNEQTANFLKEDDADFQQRKEAQVALDELKKKALALPKPDERLSVRTKSMSVPVADAGDPGVKVVWNEECFVIGQEYLSRFPQLKDQFVPDVSFELADGRVYRPKRVAVVPGNAFGFSRKAAIALRLVPGSRFKAAVRFDFPDRERAELEKRARLFE